MKHTKHLVGALTLAMFSGLAACSSEDLLPGEQVKGKAMPMTVTVSKGDVTRATLTENTAEGTLDVEWDENDILGVYDKNGGNCGVLTLKEKISDNVGVFDGEAVIDDKALAPGNYHLVYMGKKSDNYDKINVASGHLYLDLSNQVGASVSDLEKYDVKGNPVNIAIVGDRAVNTENIELSALAAMARFSLSGIPADTEGTLYISSVAGTDTNPVKVAYDFSSGSRVNITDAENDKIKIENVTVGKDVYVALAPRNDARLSFRFEANDGKVYTHEFQNPTDIKSGIYCCSIEGDETSGITVSMTESNELYGEYANEDPRNPLHKFAKYNLVRVGDRGSLENGFAGTATENGALYQWGRNYGYMDKSGTYPGSNVRISGDFTNYFDALGEFTWYDAWNNVSTSSSMNYYRLFDCYVYPEDAVVMSGTGLGGYGDGYQHWANIDNYERYGSVDVIKAHPDKYFFDTTNNSTDYWLSSFSGGGSKWTDRATACGYENSNPCPEGWRLPTEDDFKEICPSAMPSYSGDLSTLITNKAKPELRETKSGVRYVIRWLNFNGYLKIQAVVVDTDFKESDIAALVWDNNSAVVERDFPFTGNISPYRATDTRLSNYLGGSILVMFPYTLGTVTQTGQTASSYYYYYPWTLFTPNKNYGSAIGGYWISDSQKTFQFFDRSKAGNSGSSSIEIRTTDAQMGYAIRPVMDKNRNLKTQNRVLFSALPLAEKSTDLRIENQSMADFRG